MNSHMSLVWRYIVQNHCVYRITTWNVQLTGYLIILMRLTRKKWTSSPQQNHSIWMEKEVCIRTEMFLYSI